MAANVNLLIVGENRVREAKLISNAVFALTIGASLVLAPLTASAADYWVSKSGNDANGCTKESTDECLTIQRAISLAGPGDTINVKAGTYLEDSSKSAFTKPCSWMGQFTASLCMMEVSGTKASPITLQAAKGDEGKVIVDSQNVRVGLQTGSSDYLHIKGMSFFNNRIIGIASWGQPQNVVPDEDKLGVGLLIENNYFYNTWGPWGVNTSAIGMWGSKDWVVRNNKIEKVRAEGTTLASGIQSYGVINALVEHNEISDVDFGIFWKDHFVKDPQRTHYFESEIRYNLINASVLGIQFGIRGQDSVEAGDSYVHHNIVYGFSGSGLFGNMAGAFGPSGSIRIENNIFDGMGKNGSTGITLDAHDPATIKGNIIVGTSVQMEIKKYSSTKYTELEFSNYNIFDPTFRVIVDRYSPSSKTFHSLSDWQSAKASGIFTLGIDNPDAQSIQAERARLFKNTGGADYLYSSTSPALGFMPDKTNAGPYQIGNERIGRVASDFAFGGASASESQKKSRPLSPTPKISSKVVE